MAPQQMTKRPKRPRDLNQWAKRMVDIATGAVSDREPTPEEQGKNPAAVARGHLGGVRRQSFWDRERLKIRESLARLVFNVMRPADGAASGDWRLSFI